MSHTIHKNNNPFSTFALRGGRLRKCGRGVVSYAPFLAGAASAVVLGSMLVLSTPSFAQDSTEEFVVCPDPDTGVTSTGTNKAGVFVISPITIGREDIDTATGRDVKDDVLLNDSYPNNSFSYLTDNTGFHKTTITTSGTANGDGENTGVRFYRTGDGTICLVNGATISGAGKGIEATHSGTGVLGVSNSGAITNARRHGITATHSNTGDGVINISSSDGAISANVTGIFAEHTGEGGIRIENSSQITVAGANVSEDANGIEVKHNGEGDIDIENSAQINARDSGIYAVRSASSSDGDINITSSIGTITANAGGIYAKHAGEGDIDINNSSRIDVDGDNASEEAKGIKAKHSGEGDVEIENSAQIDAEDDGIYVEHTDEGDVDVENSALINAGDDGIYVEHTGEEDVEIENSAQINAGDDGVYVEHTDEGDVDVENSAQIDAGDDGIYVEHTGEGDIDVENSALINAGDDGIYVEHTGDENVKIENSAQINAINNGIYVVRSASSSDGDVNIISLIGTITANIRGIYAKHAGEGDIDIGNSSQIDAEGDNASEEAKGIEVKHTGEGDVKIENFAQIDAEDDGVYVEQAGEGDVDIENFALIDAGDDGIYVEHTGEGDVDIENSAQIDTEGDGVYVEHTGEGDRDIDITLERGANIVSGGKGIYAKRAGGGSGDIAIVLKDGSSVVTENDNRESRGIEVQHDGSGLVDIDVSSEIDSSRGNGMFVERRGNGEVNIGIEGTVSGSQHGVWVKHHGTGKVVVSAKDESRIRGGFWHDGIHVDHIGGGLVEINVEKWTNSDPLGLVEGVSGSDNAIRVSNTGSQAIDIDIDGSVRGEIHARHIGGGRIVMDVQGDVRNGFGRGINAQHSGVGDIDIVVRGNGEVFGGSAGITASNNGRRGNINVIVQKNARVTGIGKNSSGIDAYHRTGEGSITIDVSGSVSSSNSNNDYAISMQSRGDNTLILRPHSSLGGSGKVISFGTGRGILKLTGPVFGAASATYGNLDLGKFVGFKDFVKEYGSQRVTGTSLSRFENATIAGGLLYFSNARFRMASGLDRFFVVQSLGYLTVSEQNTLEGNLDNKGRIVFVGGSTNHPTELNVEYYRGSSSGDLVFNLGSNGWQNQKLKITEGFLESVSSSTSVSAEHPDSLMVATLGNSGWLIEAKGESRARVFTGSVDIDGIVYNLEHNYNASDTGRENKWHFVRNGVTPPAMAPGVLPQIVRLPEVTVEVEGPDDEHHDGGRSFRADSHGHEGGIWAERRSLRALQESGMTADSRLRMEGNLVHFGFDLPAQSFMGGDVVLGAGVLQGLSISSISSSVGKSFIGVESHAASLRASWWSPDGLYADGQTQYVRFSSGISSAGISMVEDNEGVGMSASAELGYRFALSLGRMDFEVVPQAQLVWSGVGFDDFVGSRGERISLEDGDLMTGRLGLSWDGEWDDVGGSGRIYGGVNLRDALDGRTAVNVSGVSLVGEQDDLSIGGRLGISYEWDDGYSFYGEAKASRHGSVEEVSANLGVSIEF